MMYYDLSLGYDQPIMYAVVWGLWRDKSFELLAPLLYSHLCEIQSTQLTNN